jgi:hypothetical protein
MKFEEAFQAMRNGKKIKLPDRDFFLSLIGKIYYDNDDCKPAEIISSNDILRDDWEIVE